LPEAASPAVPDPGVLSLGNLTLSQNTPGAWVDEEFIRLTYHESLVLRLFCEQANHVLPYNFLATSLWKECGRQEMRHLNVLIHRLRGKLSGSYPYSIETVRGRGYGLINSTKPS
jgi:DNA-binding response OmpR family regulator